MEKKIEKGSPEWNLFQEFWKFRQKYHDADDNDQWWIKAVDEGSKIVEKYRGTELEKFAYDLVFGSCLEDTDRRFKARIADGRFKGERKRG